MSESIEKFEGFKPTAERAHNGIALIYDLEGFSRFFNQPDIHEYIPKYLNHVIGAVENAIYGGVNDFIDETDHKILPFLPEHRKFMGDGSLYVWVQKDIENIFTQKFIGNLCNRLWNIKKAFGKLNTRITSDVPVFELPQKIRFGIARGTIYELTTDKGDKEYIGFCINLASRLQSYCPSLGFIASARINLENSSLQKNGYVKVVAKKIKGFPKEIVIVDKTEYLGLAPDLKKDLFEEINPIT